MGQARALEDCPGTIGLLPKAYTTPDFQFMMQDFSFAYNHSLQHRQDHLAGDFNGCHEQTRRQLYAHAMHTACRSRRRYRRVTGLQHAPLDVHRFSPQDRKERL